MRARVQLGPGSSPPLVFDVRDFQSPQISSPLVACIMPAAVWPRVIRVSTANILRKSLNLLLSLSYWRVRQSISDADTLPEEEEVEVDVRFNHKF